MTSPVDVAPILRKLLGSLAGAALAGTLSYVAIGPVLRWYSNRYIYNDADITTAYLWANAALVFAAAIGALLGWRLARRYNTRRQPEASRRF